MFSKVNHLIINNIIVLSIKCAEVTENASRFLIWFIFRQIKRKIGTYWFKWPQNRIRIAALYHGPSNSNIKHFKYEYF